jgi:hypothetical protein
MSIGTFNNININKDDKNTDKSLFDRIFGNDDNIKYSIIDDNEVNKPLKPVKNFQDLFEVNNYESISFGPITITNDGNRLIFHDDIDLSSYYHIRAIYENNIIKTEYHMYNGIIYYISYNLTNQKIGLSTKGGFETFYENIKYEYK